MTRQPWNWGIPVNIPAPDFYDDEPCELASLKFSPVGLYDLRRRIGVLTAEPGVYNQHQAQFDASDLAWFAALLSSFMEIESHHHELTEVFEPLALSGPLLCMACMSPFFNLNCILVSTELITQRLL